VATTLGAIGAAAVRAPDERLDRIGLQLYTVRRDMARDVDRVLAAVAAIGYREVEFAGYFDRSPAQIRRALDANGLKAPGVHVGGPSSLIAEWERTVATAREIGHEFIVCPWIDAADRGTADDWRRIADTFNRAGELAKRDGLRFAYHNHAFEFTRIGDTIPFDILLERTEPSLVAFEMDLYWIVKGGQRPLDYFARWPGRFPLVHVKDMQAGPDQTMVDVGRGVIDFKAIFAKHRQAGIEHYFVEHDEPAPDGLTSARVSYDALRRLTW
jgi:sugar phosphate isomerase/epimerase